MMTERKTNDILNMISALQRLEIGDLDRLVRIRNRILDNDIRQDDIDYVYDMFDHVRYLKRDDAPISGRKSSRTWYLLPIFLSIIGGIIAYLGLRHVDPPRARKTLLLGSGTFAIFVTIVAAGIVSDETDIAGDPPANAVDETIYADEAREEVDAVPEKIKLGSESEAATASLHEYETHTVSYTDIPDYADPDLATPALEHALYAWEYSNTFLQFEIVESDADLHIEWMRWIPAGNLGLHTVFDKESGSAENHVITIRLGNDDCHSDYQLYHTESLKHTVAHEIGHYLGLRHIDDEDHLMYSGEFFDVDTVSTYDNRGYSVPDIAKPTLRTQHGQDILLQIESAKKILLEIILEREDLKTGTADQDLLLLNTERHNEVVRLLDSLDDDLECVEISGKYLPRLK